MVAVKEVPQDQASCLGILSLGQLRRNLLSVKVMSEKPAQGEEPSNQAVVGRYILKPNIFKYIETQRFGSWTEVQLTDAIANEISMGSLVNGF